MFTARILTIVAVTPLLVAATTRGGVVRYELLNLLGEHRFDGSQDVILGRFAHVDTPFGFYSVTNARLVVEGTVAAGRAYGDGVLREALEFDLNPRVDAQPSFSRVIELSPTSVGTFRIDRVYLDPFVPETIPLPNPDGYPPVSFDVSFLVGPNFDTAYPPRITPPPGAVFLPWYDGVVVDIPIVANVTAAYIVLEGPGVPEPSSGVIAAIAALIVGLMRLRDTGIAGRRTTPVRSQGRSVSQAG